MAENKIKIVKVSSKKIKHFFEHTIWKMQSDHDNSKKHFFLKVLRVIAISFKDFKKDHCFDKAIRLTYYSLFSIVPIVALAFAIAKGLGFQETLKEHIMKEFDAQKETMTYVFIYADKMLNNTKSGIIAGVGIVVLLWTIIKLLGGIENSFNIIWEAKEDRRWARKFTDYFSIMFITPILLVLSGSLTLNLQNVLQSIFSEYHYFGPVVFLIASFLGFSIIWGMFTFLFISIPNTKIDYKAAAISGFFTALMFQLLEYLYITSQIGVASYNRIYGSFAALPLFLVWMQYSWLVVLWGAELCFAIQNINKFDLKNEISNLSFRYKKIVAILVSNCVIKNFLNNATPLTDVEISKKINIPITLVQNIISELLEIQILNEVIIFDSKIGYQPALSENKITVNMILQKLDAKGVNQLSINNNDLDKVRDLVISFENTLHEAKGSILLKNAF